MDISDFISALRYGAYVETGLPFIASNTSLGTAELNSGPGTVVLLAGSAVPVDRTAYVTGFAVVNTSATLVGAGSIYIEDTAGVPIWGFPIVRATTGDMVTASGTPGVELLRYDCSASAINTGIVIGTSGSITSDGTLSAVIWGLQK